MKIKDTILVALVIILSGDNCFAQFNTSQKFNSQVPDAPYYGFDRVREQNQIIIAQGLVNSEWQNQMKIATLRLKNHPELFSEIGTYKYYTSTQKWVENIVYRYKINYDVLNKQVSGAVEERRYEYDLYNEDYQYQFTFNSNGPDSLAVSIVNGGLEYATKHKYDVGGKLNETYEWYPTNSSLTTFYDYDSQDRVVSSLVIYKSSSGLADTSSRINIGYDSLGRIKEHVYMIHWMNGSPYEWTVTRRLTYQYDQNSHIINCIYSRYNIQKDYLESVFYDYQYGYNQSGDIIQYVESSYNDMGEITFREKVVIGYSSANQADTGYGYEWNGASYNIQPSTRYLFSQVNTSMAEAASYRKLGIWPNPASNKIYFERIPKGEIVITDCSGKQVVKTKGVSEIDIHFLSPGLYFVLTDGNSLTKVLKE